MKATYIIIALAWCATLFAAFSVGSKSAKNNDESATLTGNASGERSTTRSSSRDRSAATARQTQRGRTSANTPSDKEVDIKELLKNTDPISRTQNLLNYINRLSADEFEQAVADFRSLGDTGEKMSEYAMLLHAWGKADPLAALDYAEKNTGTPFARQTILASWAADSPDAALSWAQQRHEGEGANPWLVGVIRGVVTTGDTSRATDIMQMLPLSRERAQALNSIVPLVLQSGKEKARQWLDTITDERLRQGGVTYLASAMARKDPADAADWISSIDDAEAVERAAGNIAGIWADTDLDAALVWTNNLSENAKARATQEIMPRYARQDPEKAAAWLSTLSNQENYSRIVQGYIWTTARNNPGMALAQIPRITNERSRARYYERILRSWKQRDAAAAEAWINSNELPDSVKQRLQRSRQRQD